MWPLLAATIRGISLAAPSRQTYMYMYMLMYYYKLITFAPWSNKTLAKPYNPSSQICTKTGLLPSNMSGDIVPDSSRELDRWKDNGKTQNGWPCKNRYW